MMTMPCPFCTNNPHGPLLVELPDTINMEHAVPTEDYEQLTVTQAITKAGITKSRSAATRNLKEGAIRRMCPIHLSTYEKLTEDSKVESIMGIRVGRKILSIFPKGFIASYAN